MICTHPSKLFGVQCLAKHGHIQDNNNYQILLECFSEAHYIYIYSVWPQKMNNIGKTQMNKIKKREFLGYTQG